MALGTTHPCRANEHPSAGEGAVQAPQLKHLQTRPEEEELSSGCFGKHQGRSWLNKLPAVVRQ